MKLLVTFLCKGKVNFFSSNLFQNKLRKQAVAVIGWCLASILGLTVVYGIYGATKQGGKPFNKVENILYGTFSRLTWGLALAWVIYACNRGYGSK